MFDTISLFFNWRISVWQYYIYQLIISILQNYNPIQLSKFVMVARVGKRNVGGCKWNIGVIWNVQNEMQLLVLLKPKNSNWNNWCLIGLSEQNIMLNQTSSLDGWWYMICQTRFTMVEIIWWDNYGFVPIYICDWLDKLQLKIHY